MSNDNYPTPSWDSVLASTYGMSVLVNGLYAAGNPGADTTIDFQFSDDREVQGGDVSAWDPSPGDSITIGVYSPIDPSTGEPLPEPVEVRRVATNAMLPAGKTWSMRVGYSMGFPAGLIFRVTYHSVGGSPPKVTVNLLTWILGTGV